MEYKNSSVIYDVNIFTLTSTKVEIEGRAIEMFGIRFSKDGVVDEINGISSNSAIVNDYIGRLRRNSVSMENLHEIADDLLFECYAKVKGDPID